MNKKSPLKTVRVFVSSTFRDMHAERDYLNSSVFPELRSRCAKKGLDFVGIDLRWGVTEEESRQRKAMKVCLDEIKKCNFFISLLGDRYGWIPPPDDIPEDIFESARKKNDINPEYANLLDEWYQLDQTSKIPVYRLQDRFLFSWDEVPDKDSAKFIEFLTKNFNIDWIKKSTIEKLNDSQTLRIASGKNSLILKLNDEKTKINLIIDNGRTDQFFAKEENGKLNIYSSNVPNDITKKLICFWEVAGLQHAGDSITAREIFHSLYDNSDKNLLFYFRKSGVHLHSDFPQFLVPIFIENNPENKNKLSHLKQEIRKRSQKEITDYEASYDGFGIDPFFLPHDLTDLEKKALEDGVIQPEERQNLKQDFRSAVEKYGTVALTGMEKLGDIIQEDIWKAIGLEAENVSIPLDPHSQEREYHQRFIENRTQLFVGRKDKLKRMLSYIIDKDDRTALVITGKPGCGKSALMAECARQCSQKFSDALVVPHFIGAAPGSTDLLSTIRSLCETLRRECKLKEEVSADPDILRGQLQTFLEKAGSVRSTIILLDAVNQLDPAYRSHELMWMPLTLPPNVRLIVSTLEGDCLDRLKKRVPKKNIKNVPILPKEYRKSLIKKHLARRGKKLSDSQIACLLDTKVRKEAGLPLYLMVALDELCLFGNYDELNHRINKLPATLNKLFDQVIDRLEKDHTANRTELILRLMAVSRYGLLESEILDQLGGDYLFNWDSIPGNDINRLVKFLKNDIKINFPENIEIIKIDDNKNIRVSSKEISIDIKLDEKNENAILKSNTGETCTLQLKRENGRLNIHKMDFPRIYWTRFYRSLEFYLRPVDETTGSGLINFYHDQLRFAVYRRYLGMMSSDVAKTEKYRHSHNQLADYFHSIASDKHEPAKWSTENPRSLIELPYHLVESGRDEELRKMLSDFNWLNTKLEATNVNSLVIDYDFLPNDKKLNLVKSALRLSEHVLLKDKTQFRSQINGRLMGQEVPEIKALLDQIIKWKDNPWIRTLTQSLTPPGGPLIRTLIGHKGPIRAIAVYSDGKYAISASDDRTLKIWDLKNGDMLGTLQGHTSSVLSLAVFSDGKRAISGSEDKKLKIWDIENGNVIKTFAANSSVLSISLFSDGKRAIYASDNMLIILDLESGNKIKTLSDHSDLINQVTILPDDKRAISASYDNTLKVWDIENGKVIRTLNDHTGSVNDLAILPDGEHIISASSDETLKVWDLVSGNVLHTLNGHNSYVNAVVALPNSKRAISASTDNTLKIWNLESGEVIRTLKGHTESIEAISVISDGKNVISASEDKTLKIWDTESEDVNQKCLSHDDRLLALSLLPDGKRLISASFDSTLKVWDLKTRELLQTIKDNHSYFTTVAALPDGERLISASLESNMMKIWNLETEKIIKPFGEHNAPIYAVIIMPDGKKVISASADNTLKIWDLENGKLLHTLKGHKSFVLAVAVLLNGKEVISASSDSTLKLWDIETEKVLLTFEGHTEPVPSVAVLPEGKRVISASWDKTLKIWDLESGKVLKTLNGHTDRVKNVVVLPEGKRAISISDDSTLKVWDLESGKVLYSFCGDGPLLNCVFSQKEEIIVAGESSGKLHFLRIEGE